MQNHMLCGFDFIVAPLARPDYRPPSASAEGGKLVAPFKKEDVLYLNSSQYINQVGKGIACDNVYLTYAVLGKWPKWQTAKFMDTVKCFTQNSASYASYCLAGKLSNSALFNPVAGHPCLMSGCW
jgi:hypothetical protein